MDGFDQVPFGDHEALKAAVGPETAAILVEPIQGEGGVRQIPAVCLKGLRELCDEHGILLIFDEVQTGIGRTGKLFAHEWAGISPDILASAKGLGGGFPVGACLATEAAAAALVAGSPGPPIGGKPLAMGLRLKQSMAEVVDHHPDVFEGVRGEGLLVGLKCKAPTAEVLAAMRVERVLGIGAGENVIRLLPPLIISEDDIREAARRIDAAASAVTAAHAAGSDQNGAARATSAAKTA